MLDTEYNDFTVTQESHFLTFQGKSLFYAQVDGDALWDRYIQSFPEGPTRNYFDCSACRRFIRRYGSLVVIEEDGSLTPAIWPSPESLAPNNHVFRALTRRIRSQFTGVAVVGPFYSDQEILGTPHAGGWEHLAVKHKPDVPYRNKTPRQAMAIDRDDFGLVQRTLALYSAPMLRDALTFLEVGAQDNSLYRASSYVDMMEWLVGLAEQFGQGASTPTARNRLWRAFSRAPQAYRHAKNTVLGNFIQWYQEHDPQTIRNLWASALNPLTYQRAQRAPTANQIVIAQSKFADMGLGQSVPRRLVGLAEIPSTYMVWRAPEPQVRMTTKKSSVDLDGLFGDVLTVEKVKAKPATRAQRVPTATMTWVRFRDEVLPKAEQVLYSPTPGKRNFVALTRKVHESAPNLLWWNNNGSNPYAWYYEGGGVDSPFRQRVVRAGGQYDDVHMRMSLLWGDRNDLDLHCRSPLGHIHFNYKHCRTGGFLDVDMNIRGETTKPVENIMWPASLDKFYPGTYTFWVENYRFHEAVRKPSPFRVEMEVFGRTFQGEAVMRQGVADLSRVDLARVVITEDRQVQVFTDLMYRTDGTDTRHPGSTPGERTKDPRWNVPREGWAKVEAIVPSPDAWNSSRGLGLKQMFFLLEGAKDTQPEKGHGVPTEGLVPTVRECRRVIETYYNEKGVAPLDSDEPNAAGVGFTDQRPWNAAFRVVTKTGVRDYTIDRWH